MGSIFTCLLIYHVTFQDADDPAWSGLSSLFQPSPLGQSPLISQTQQQQGGNVTNQQLLAAAQVASAATSPNSILAGNLAAAAAVAQQQQQQNVRIPNSTTFSSNTDFDIRAYHI